MKATEVLADLQRRFPNEPEYLQAVEEVITTSGFQRSPMSINI